MAAAGLVVRNRGVFEFIPAALLRALRYDFVVTPYPGTEIGMTLFSGRVIPVLSYGDDGHALIVCDIEGEIVGLTGLDPIQSGLLEGDDRSAVYEGVRVPHLNVREQLDRSRPQRRLQEEPWPT